MIKLGGGRSASNWMQPGAASRAVRLPRGDTGAGHLRLEGALEESRLAVTGTRGRLAAGSSPVHLVSREAPPPPGIRPAYPPL